MNFIHTALVCSSEKNSDRFYKELLGLSRIKSSKVPYPVINKISSINKDMNVITYGNNDFIVEIFISKEAAQKKAELIHTCIGIKNRGDFYKRCISFDLRPFKIEKGDSFILFVNDYDNNLFEIKETP